VSFGGERHSFNFLISRTTMITTAAIQQEL
jgi:hypothetical protein